MRVNADELEYDGDISLYNGLPFSGISYELFPDGSLKCEAEYKNGFENGLTKIWYPDAKIQSKESCKRGLRNGEYKEWHPEGSVKIIALYKFGIELHYSEWDKQSNLIVSREASYEDAKYKGLENFVALHGDEFYVDE